MENYTVHEEIGKGSFGSVFRATRKKDNKPVAIKKLFEKYDDWDAVLTMREFRAIVDLPKGSEHICHVYDIIRETDGTLYFTMELMQGGSLKDYIESFWSPSQSSDDTIGSKQIDHSSIRSILWQVLQGLKHMHSKGYMHRDLKPENILMNGKVFKVTDFSLARTMALLPVENIDQGSSSHQYNDQRPGYPDQSRPQHDFGSQKAPSHRIHNAAPPKMTSYVSTRWYRAPEIILCAPQYSTAVDIFAFGCVMAELYRLVPLLPGSGEIPQLAMICELWGGVPNCYQHWPEGKRLAQKMGLEVMDHHPQATNHESRPIRHVNSMESICLSKLQTEVPSACMNALTLMESCLRINPNARPTASKALQHDYFRQIVDQCSPASSRQIGSVTPSPKTHTNAWYNCDASFLNGYSAAGYENHQFHQDWDENAIRTSPASSELMYSEYKMQQVMPSALKTSSVFGLLSPSNVSNANISSIGLDKASLVRGFGSKKRHWRDSITNSNRKKRENGYKPSGAFLNERKH